MFNDTKLYLISDIETRLSCLLVRIHPIIIRCILRKQSSAPYFLLTLGFQTPSEIQPTHQTSFTRFDPSLPPIQQFRLNNFWNEILSWNESLPFHELCHHLIWTEKKNECWSFSLCTLILSKWFEFSHVQIVLLFEIPIVFTLILPKVEVSWAKFHRMLSCRDWVFEKPLQMMDGSRVVLVNGVCLCLFF